MSLWISRPQMGGLSILLLVNKGRQLTNTIKTAWYSLNLRASYSENREEVITVKRISQ